MPHSISRCHRATVLLAGPLLALLLPAIAAAHGRTITPPGFSAVGQYTESVPTAKGNRPTGTITPGGGGPSAPGGASGAGGPTTHSAGALSQKTLKALAKQGSAGVQAAALAEAAGTTSSARRRSGSSSSLGGSSPLSTLAKAATGSASGLGSALPVIFVVVAVAGMALGLQRRRTAS
jgi:hypothetical protein